MASLIQVICEDGAHRRHSSGSRGLLGAGAFGSWGNCSAVLPNSSPRSGWGNPDVAGRRGKVHDKMMGWQRHLIRREHKLDVHHLGGCVCDVLQPGVAHGQAPAVGSTRGKNSYEQKGSVCRHPCIRLEFAFCRLTVHAVQLSSPELPRALQTGSC